MKMIVRAFLNLKVDVFVASTIARFQQMDYDGIVANEVVFMAIVNIWGYVSYRKSEIWMKWLWRWLPGHFWAKIVEWSSRVFIGYRKPMARRKPSYYLNIKFASKMMIITTFINYHRIPHVLVDTSSFIPWFQCYKITLLPPYLCALVWSFLQIRALIRDRNWIWLWS